MYTHFFNLVLIISFNFSAHPYFRIYAVITLNPLNIYILKCSMESIILEIYVH